MPRFSIPNPFVVETVPPADPAIRVARVREYLRREIPMTYGAQGSSLLVMLTGWSLDSLWVILLGVLRLVVDQYSRTRMKHLQVDIERGIDPEPILRKRRWLYLLIGFSWGTIMWPVFLLDGGVAAFLLGTTAVVALVMMGTTVCFVPSLYTTTLAGFVLAMSRGFFLPGMSGLMMLVSLPILVGLVWELARSTLIQFTGMLEAQYERDRALVDQGRTIAQLHEAHDRVAVLAATDTVTQLPNRQAFVDWLRQHTTRSEQPITLLLLDLDHFKNINDTMGHHVGDAVLEAMGRALAHFPCETPGVQERSFAARLGGDEFALVLPWEVSASQFEASYARWLRVLAQLGVAGVGTMSVGSSCGSAVYPRDAGDARSLLHAADLALRTAKGNCRGTHRAYEPLMMQTYEREAQIAHLLARSIDEGNFQIVLQPQVRIDDGSVVAAEALTRFRCEQLRQFPVQAVFDAAEERGLGPRLAGALMEQTGREIVALMPRLSQPVRIAVNLSPSALKNPQALMGQLQDWLAAGVDPALVMLELTEDAISGRGLDGARQTMEAVVQMGFELSLDDFGTGQASLQHLHSLPIHEVKIAKQFVDEVCCDRKDQAIVRSAVAMCDHMEIACIVEGVETEEQVRMLRSLGARYAQGYRWARPMPIDDFVAFCREAPKPSARPGTPAGAEDIAARLGLTA